MAVVSMKQFIESGVHFGHQTRRWNPRMKPYIFGTKNGIHIIDLQKSLRMLREAYEFVRDLSARGESILFVGTKPQAREIIAEEAIRSGSFYINERWLGGLLTNFNTIKISIGKLKRLEEQRGEHGLYEGILKKEAVRMERQREKLERALGGIKEMRKLPGALFVIDCKKERIALDEAKKLGVPIVAVVDTNCDPEGIARVIPGNDDAIRAIRLFTGTIASAVLEGRGLYEAQQRSEQQEAKKPARTRGSRAKPAAEAEPTRETGAVTTGEAADQDTAAGAVEAAGSGPRGAAPATDAPAESVHPDNAATAVKANEAQAEEAPERDAAPAAEATKPAAEPDAAPAAEAAKPAAEPEAAPATEEPKPAAEAEGEGEAKSE